MLIKIDELRKCNTVKDTINKMFEMCYTTTEIMDMNENTGKKELYSGKVESFMGKTCKTFGYYMKHRKMDMKERETRFDTYFKACENIYVKLFNTNIEKNDMEEHLQEARLQGLQAFYNYVEDCMRLPQGIDITTVDKLCDVLVDEEKCAMLYSYLLRIVKSTAYKSLYQEGKRTSSSRDCYSKRVTVNGVRKVVTTKVKSVSIDKYSQAVEGNELNNYTLLDAQNESEGKRMDVEGNIFTESSSTGILKYILCNKDRIFTKKQLEKLELLLNEGKTFGDVHNRRKYEATFRNKVFEILQNDKNCYIENEQLRLKNIDFIDAVESIINAPTPLEQFNIIKDVFINKSDFTNTLFIDLIYGLEEDIIYDLVYCLTEEVDENWLESDGFNEVIEVLVKEYNYQVKNAKLMYQYNRQKRISKEDKVINYIEKKCFFVEGQKFGLASKSSKGGDFIPNNQEIADFINRVYGETFDKKQMKVFLKDFGYDINTSKRTVKNNIPCYKVFRLEK